jgi:hypothetical protein
MEPLTKDYHLGRASLHLEEALDEVKSLGCPRLALQAVQKAANELASADAMVQRGEALGPFRTDGEAP